MMLQGAEIILFQNWGKRGLLRKDTKSVIVQMLSDNEF